MVNIAENKFEILGSGLEKAIIDDMVYIRFNSANNLGLSGTQKTYSIATSHGIKEIGINHKELDLPIKVGINVMVQNIDYVKPEK